MLTHGPTPNATLDANCGSFERLLEVTKTGEGGDDSVRDSYHY